MSWLRTRAVIEAEERDRLAPFAMRSGDSLGRVVPEEEHPYRTAFQRDRDRIVHSRAFRRLEYKTQVFVHHEGDHYRNRLTHTLEGAQIARTIARALRLNEELAEAVALAHDLGHTPFGHAGERALAEAMKRDGGFDHNRQSLRVVDLLEERYPDFRGLNLTAETREGILKHGCHWPHPVALPDLSGQRPLEAQLADVADEIAYVNHDLDDGLRAGLLSEDMLEPLGLWRAAQARVAERVAGASLDVARAQTIVALIDGLVTDLLSSSARRIDEAQPQSPEEVRNAGRRLIAFSEACEADKRALKSFLLKNVYQHPHVHQMTLRAETIVSTLHQAYCQDPHLLPERARERFEIDGASRAIADHVACMTDRYAEAEYAKRVGGAGDPRAGGPLS